MYKVQKRVKCLNLNFVSYVCMVFECFVIFLRTVIKILNATGYQNCYSVLGTIGIKYIYIFFKESLLIFFINIYNITIG